VQFIVESWDAEKGHCNSCNVNRLRGNPRSAGQIGANLENRDGDMRDSNNCRALLKVHMKKRISGRN